MTLYSEFRILVKFNCFSTVYTLYCWYFSWF